MLKLKVTRNGSTLSLTESNRYQLVSSTGLNPPVADISLSQLATADGGIFNNARGQSRNIVLTVQPLGGIEARRLEIYEYFTPKSMITLDVETSNRHVKIDGYVESVEIDFNSNPQLFQISIICPNPYFKSVTKVTETIPGVVTNPSEAVQGAEFTLTLTGSGSSLVLTNQTTDETLTINDTFTSGQQIKIVTIQGQKMVTFNGQSRMAYVDLTSDWPQLAPGDNTISVSGVSCTAVCEFYPLFTGV